MVDEIETTKPEEESQTKTNSRWQTFLEKIKNLSPIINLIMTLATITIAAYAIFQYCSFKGFSKKQNRAYITVVNPVLDTLSIYNIDLSHCCPGISQIKTVV